MMGNHTIYSLRLLLPSDVHCVARLSTVVAMAAAWRVQIQRRNVTTFRNVNLLILVAMFSLLCGFLLFAIAANIRGSRKFC